MEDFSGYLYKKQTILVTLLHVFSQGHVFYMIINQHIELSYLQQSNITDVTPPHKQNHAIFKDL